MKFSNCPYFGRENGWHLWKMDSFSNTLIYWIVGAKSSVKLAGQGDSGTVWSRFIGALLQSIIYHKYFPVTWRKMPPKPAATIYFFTKNDFVPLTSHACRQGEASASDPSIYRIGVRISREICRNQFVTWYALAHFWLVKHQLAHEYKWDVACGSQCNPWQDLSSCGTRTCKLCREGILNRYRKGERGNPPEIEKIGVEKWCYFRRLYF